MSKWQPKTRGGWPVENVRRHDNAIWKWTGEVTCPGGIKGTLTWTEDGYHWSHEQPTDSDLIPLESPVEAPTEPDARKALAEAARAFKRACDALDAAEEARELTQEAYDAAYDACGRPDLGIVVDVDGATVLFDAGGPISPVEVL
jgi:hypothetical protein